MPLWCDLTNPSPAIGWGHAERDSLIDRGPADMVLALALIHHLLVSGNITLEQMSTFFAQLTRWLAIEWVPKTDVQVQRLLRSREDIFADYTLESFRTAFGRHFEIVRDESVGNDGRRMFLLKNRHE